MTMANKWWTKFYPAGVPAEVDVGVFNSLPAMAEASFKTYRDRAMYTCLGKTLTYGEVDKLSTAFGAWLQAQGLPQG
ncbi:MAG: long-chain fatty acid--CoA ligase, partial [Betaproteobacteria bacterium]|nr:long-chain fatty acid--CoA ligase [Betaproteobacteria bacterium]